MVGRINLSLRREALLRVVMKRRALAAFGSAVARLADRFVSAVNPLFYTC